MALGAKILFLDKTSDGERHCNVFVHYCLSLRHLIAQVQIKVVALQLSLRPVAPLAPILVPNPCPALDCAVQPIQPE